MNGMPRYCHCAICNEPDLAECPHGLLVRDEDCPDCLEAGDMDTPDPAAVEEALALADEIEPDGIIPEAYVMVAPLKTLAAAVRELRDRQAKLEWGKHSSAAEVAHYRDINDQLRESNKAFMAEWDGMVKRTEQAEAVLAALKGRTCDKCKWQHSEFPNVCTNDNLHGNWLSCKDLGFTCGTWAERIET